LVERVPGEQLAGTRRRWQLWSDWTLDDGRTGGARIDVLDAENGWWAVEPDQGGGTLTARATTATEVWRAMVRLVMRRDVDAG
jgi:hypothetical protein